MKKALLVLILILAVVTVSFAATLCFAYAGEEEDAPAVTTITHDYFELGALHSIATNGETLAAVESQEATVSIVLLGDQCQRIALPDGVEVEASSIRLALGDATLLADFGGEALYAYSLEKAEWEDTALVTTLKQGYSSFQLAAFCVDPETDVLYMGYGTLLLWIDLADALGESVEYGDRYHNFNSSTHPYDQMYALDGVVYFFSKEFSRRFTLSQEAGNMVASEAVGPVADYAAYAPADWFLREGAVYYGDDLAIAQAGEGDNKDKLLYDAAVLAATKEYLFVADNGQGAVKQYDPDGNLVRMWGTWGESSDRLHDPSHLTAGALVVINDRGNQRVVVYDPEQKDYTVINVVADEIATYGNLVYIAQGELVDVYDLTKPQASWRKRKAQVVGEVTALAADASGAYAVAEGHLYTLSDEPGEWVSVEHAGGVKVGKHDGVVYVLSDQDLITCYKDGLLVAGVELSLKELDLLDWTTDLYGNVYALTPTMIHVYTRHADGFTPAKQVALVGCQSLEISPDGVVYALKDHALVQVELGVPTEETQSTPPQAATNVGTRAIKLNVNEVWGYSSPDNYESIVCVTHPYAMLIAVVTEGEEQFWYAECTVKGERYPNVYIPYDKATLVGDKAVDVSIKYNGISSEVGVYEFPSNQARPLTTLPKDQALFHAKRIVGVDGEDDVWAWYEIDYAEGSAYVRIADYTIYVDPNTVHRYYVRAKAGRLGETIPMYAQPDYDSQQVATLVDGTKVELHAPFDEDTEWTHVWIDGLEGWVPTARLSESELTNGQILALILAAVVILAAIVTLLLYRVVKSKR